MVIFLKWNIWFYNAGAQPKDVDGIANSENPDQIAPFCSQLG